MAATVTVAAPPASDVASASTTNWASEPVVCRVWGFTE
jgi:hypothetical protein